MKHISVSLLLTIIMSSLFFSCGEKTKEEKFLLDFEEFIEKAEKVKTKSDAKSFEQSLEIFEKKARDLYGLEEFDNIDKSGLNFTDEQKERFYKLVERAGMAGQHVREVRNSDDTDEREEISSDDTQENEEFSSGSSSSDVDEMLDSYEEYVDDYISYLKKASNGDMSALSEYPQLMEKAQDFSQKLENCKDEMTPSQLTRYTKISMKMLEAAQQMQK